MTPLRRFLSQPLPRLVAICSLPLFLFPLIQYLAVARYGSGAFLWLGLFVVLPLFAALPAVVIAPFFLFSHRYRPLAARSLAAAAVFVIAAFAGLRLGGRIRTAGFHSLAARSAPLVQAIRSYEARHGAPPPDLASLVPGFLPGIPGTGMGAYPHYQYHVGEEAARFDANPWVLEVFTPAGGLNFDQFLYFPLQNYPATWYGGGIERISDWAYVHE